MWIISSMMAVILTLVSCPCGGAETFESTEAPVSEDHAGPPGEVQVFPRQTSDDSITYNVGDTSYVNLWDKLYYPLINGESTEEQQGYTYNSYYNVPSTVNFYDIYSNSLALLAEDRAIRAPKDDELLITLKDDEAFHLNSINTQLVEFHPKTHMVPPVTTPAPMWALNSSYAKSDFENTTSTSTSTTTEEPDEINVDVLPIKKLDSQRGLLDLLFPASRVRTFKSVFNTFKRLMSHTFR